MATDDAERLRDFERAAHTRVASSYDAFFSPVTALATPALLDAAAVGPRKRVLDVATGPGRVAAAAVARGAVATGVDLAPGMVSLARSLHPGVDFREAEVEPVYMLTRRRSSFPPPPPASSRLVVAASGEEAQRDSLADFAASQPNSEAWDGEPNDADDDVSDIRVARRFTRRRRGIRVLGALAIIGTLAGGGYVLQQPRVRHEALSFVTMGHEDAAARAGRRIATIVQALRHH